VPNLVLVSQNAQFFGIFGLSRGTKWPDLFHRAAINSRPPASSTTVDGCASSHPTVRRRRCNAGTQPNSRIFAAVDDQLTTGAAPRRQPAPNVVVVGGGGGGGGGVA